MFQPGPMVLFRRPRHLWSYLVRAKLTRWKEKQDLNRCIKNTSYEFNRSFHCNDKCSIYILTCKTCLKQYFASTTDFCRYCWNNCKCSDRKYARGEACLQEPLFKHFISEGYNGFLRDASVTLIDKTDGKNCTTWKHNWRHTIKTLAPYGLNVKNDF